MTAGRPRIHKNRRTFTNSIEADVYDRWQQICKRQGIPMNVKLQAWIEKDIASYRAQDSQITDWMGACEDSRPDSSSQVPPPFWAAMPEWVKYVYSLKNPDEYFKGRTQAERIKNIYKTAIENMNREVWVQSKMAKKNS